MAGYAWAAQREGNVPSSLLVMMWQRALNQLVIATLKLMRFSPLILTQSPVCWISIPPLAIDGPFVIAEENQRYVTMRWARQSLIPSPYTAWEMESQRFLKRLW